MALPTSGAIDLNAMHVEAGGPSGNAVGINDADVRGLIGKASGASMGFNEWYGASNSSFVIDEGSSGTNYGYSRVGQNYGSLSGGGTYHRGAQVLALYTSYFVVKGSASRLLIIRIQGSRAANWFTYVRVGSTTHYYNTFTRSYSGSTLWLKTIPASQMMDGVGNTSGFWA
jgi:hypothetical protein|tara:strand:+ start:1027 stop:1539 length:513 start_codon:yes stop_codon:yes gene_type:complete